MAESQSLDTGRPIEPDEHRRVAVKIVDDRGIESQKAVDVGE